MDKTNPDIKSEPTSEAPKREVAPAENPLVTAYRLVHEKEPSSNMAPIDLAERIIEVLDNPNWVPRDVAIECGEIIMGMRTTTDPVLDARAKKIILYFEGGVAQSLFPDLLLEDEVHMAYWEDAYNRYKKEQAKVKSSANPS